MACLECASVFSIKPPSHKFLPLEIRFHQGTRDINSIKAVQKSELVGLSTFVESAAPLQNALYLVEMDLFLGWFSLCCRKLGTASFTCKSFTMLFSHLAFLASFFWEAEHLVDISSKTSHRFSVGWTVSHTFPSYCITLKNPQGFFN